MAIDNVYNAFDLRFRIPIRSYETERDVGGHCALHVPNSYKEL